MIARSFLPLCLLAASLAPSAFGVVIRDDTPDALYQALGDRAVFASVCRVDINYGDGNGFQAIGSATLYGFNRIVSAAHVFDSSSLRGAVGVRVNFGRGRIANIDFTKPGIVNVNPGYNPRTLANDVSVVFLPNDFGVRLAKLYNGSTVRTNTTVTMVGYGNTGTGLTGSGTFSVTKRGAQNKLDTYNMGGRDFEVDFDRPGFPSYSAMGGTQPLRLEGLIGPGDSGGSVWIKRGTHWVLIGINDYGLDWYPHGNGNGVEDDYGDISGFVYLPRYTAWMATLVNPDQ